MLRQTLCRLAPPLPFPSSLPLLLWCSSSSELFCIHCTGRRAHGVTALPRDANANKNVTWQNAELLKKKYKEVDLFNKYCWTYGDISYVDWRENSQSYYHTLEALDVSPTCDAADIKSIIELLPHSSQHVTANSSHSLSDAPLQIIDIRTLRDLLSIRTQDMDLASVVFVK
jgi:hypothetical protein